MPVTDDRTTEQIYMQAEVIENKNGIVLRDPVSNKFIPTDKRKLKRKPAKVQAAASARTILYQMKRIFDKDKAGVQQLEKLLHENPSKYMEVWIKLISLYSDNKQPHTPATDHGQAILSAFQSGRLSEQLAALVQAGKHEVDRLQQAANDASKPPTTDAREV